MSHGQCPHAPIILQTTVDAIMVKHKPHLSLDLVKSLENTYYRIRKFSFSHSPEFHSHWMRIMQQQLSQFTADSFMSTFGTGHGVDDEGIL